MTVSYNKMVIAGTLPGGEVWSVNPCFASPGGPLITDFANLQTWATTVASFITTTFTTSFALGTLSSVGAPITTVTAQYFDAGNILTQQAVAPVAAQGTTSTVKMPFQVAVVCSLRTGRPGRSFRGRLYWPAMGANVNSSTARLATPSVALVTTAFNTLLKGIENSTPGTFALDLSVVSQTSSVTTPVTQLQVGDVIDTQRRRRDREAENYTVQPY